MSELISGKEALIALANGQKVLIKRERWDTWADLTDDFTLEVFGLNEYQFRLKPRTITLNGVEVGQLKTALWCINYPKEVTLEFKTEDDARHFYTNATKIFNGV